jgi:Zn/Cd-binding protein ZinT
MDENIETLIKEVEKWPAIYNKTLIEYANLNIKK